MQQFARTDVAADVLGGNGIGHHVRVVVGFDDEVSSVGWFVAVCHRPPDLRVERVGKRFDEDMGGRR